MYLFYFTEFQNLFGIIYRCSQELKEKLLMFRLVGDEINKQEWLQKLTTGLANTACMADTVRTTHRDLPYETIEPSQGNNPSPLIYVGDTGVSLEASNQRKRPPTFSEFTSHLRLLCLGIQSNDFKKKILGSPPVWLA